MLQGCCTVRSKHCDSGYDVNRELKQQRRQGQRKRHLKINILEMVNISPSHPLLFTEHAANGLLEVPLK